MAPGRDRIAPMDRLAFTGTQRGLTVQQRDSIRVLLKELRPQLVVHGGCVGGDNEFDFIATDLGIPRQIYPQSKLPSKRVPNYEFQRRLGSSVEVMQATSDPLRRNRFMVDMSSELIACPGEVYEVQRSGTWATIRYARAEDLVVRRINPSGEIINE